MCICAPCSPAGTVLPTPATALLWNPPSSRPPSVAQAGRCYAETPQSAAERSHPLHSVCAYDLAWCLWEEGACVRPMPGWDHLRSSPVGLLPRWDSLSPLCLSFPLSLLDCCLTPASWLSSFLQIPSDLQSWILLVCSSSAPTTDLTGTCSCLLKLLDIELNPVPDPLGLTGSVFQCRSSTGRLF